MTSPRQGARDCLAAASRACWSAPATLSSRVLRACVDRLPARPHAVVAGYPDDEGNSVEVVRGLADRLPVYWLVGDDPRSLAWLVADAPGTGRVRCLRKNTLGAYWAYVSARYVFFTHGLYGSPQPPSHKTYVNLWHGDGPKRRKGFAVVRSTYVVAGTRLWGGKRAQTFGVEDDQVLVTGNPRVDQFARPASDQALREVGLDPSRRLVLWLPTYRTTRYEGYRVGAVRNWSDAEELTGSAAVRLAVARIVRDAAELGVTLAVKPHPLDADTFADTGLHVITGSDLRAARTTLYQLLARADGLVTDYSSVWTDFLTLDRPIGFYCPDLDSYVTGRGLNVDDYPALLPGSLLEAPEDWSDFLHACLCEPRGSRERRAAITAAIGAETRGGATERLLDALGVPFSTDSTGGSRGG